MTKSRVLFIQGGGEGAHSADLELATALERALGNRYEVYCPRMPSEADPSASAWRSPILSELSRRPASVVAHSLGAAFLLTYLTEDESNVSITGAFMLAAPAWDGDRWKFDDLKLPDNVGERVPGLHFYQCRDDETVPFAHLALHHARVPRATFRAFDRGGHQFAGNLPAIAADIRAFEVA